VESGFSRILKRQRLAADSHLDGRAKLHGHRERAVARILASGFTHQGSRLISEGVRASFVTARLFHGHRHDIAQRRDMARLGRERQVQ
jgi:hypothetical protein